MPFRHAEGEDGETAFEQAADDPFAFGHEDALPPVCQRPAQRGVGLQFRRAKRVDFFNVRDQTGSKLLIKVSITAITAIIAITTITTIIGHDGSSLSRE
jgi:hypothetical protein